MSYDSSFIFHSVFELSFAHQRLSNRRLLYFIIYVAVANIIPSMAVTLSVRSSRLHICSSLPLLRARAARNPIMLQYTNNASYIVVLKYFRRTSTLRKFFQRKFYITKISRFTVASLGIVKSCVTALLWVANILPYALAMDQFLAVVLGPYRHYKDNCYQLLAWEENAKLVGMCKNLYGFS